VLSGAVEKEDISTVQLLLALPGGCQVNQPAGDGSTPLFRAINKGNLKMVQLLVLHGADVNLNNARQNISPLMKACDKMDTKMAEYLIHSGADMPAQLARIRNSSLRAKLLPLAENRKYFPIQTHLRRNDGQHLQVMETIQKCSADVCRLDGNWQTPYMIAKVMFEVAKTEEMRKVLIEILIHVCRVLVGVFAKGYQQTEVATSVFVKPSSTLTFSSFRYSRAVDVVPTNAAALLYFEVTILTDGLVQIGVTVPGWTPRSLTDGVGDDNESVAFDGKRQCCFVCGHQVPLETDVLASMPAWQSGGCQCDGEARDILPECSADDAEDRSVSSLGRR
jgi:hypothetical protein